MKGIVQRTVAIYKEKSGALSAATLDRALNAITYRVYGCEEERKAAYEKELSSYEKAAVKANIWSSTLPPVYRVISMAGVLFILYFGSRNVLGIGWKVFDVAAFTTFLSCFARLSVKSSSAAARILRRSRRRAQASRPVRSPSRPAISTPRARCARSPMLSSRPLCLRNSPFCNHREFQTLNFFVVRRFTFVNNER